MLGPPAANSGEMRTALLVPGMAPLVRVIRSTSAGRRRNCTKRQTASPSVAFEVIPHCHEPESVAVRSPKFGSGTILMSPETPSSTGHRTNVRSTRWTSALLERISGHVAVDVTLREPLLHNRERLHCTRSVEEAIDGAVVGSVDQVPTRRPDRWRKAVRVPLGVRLVEL